MPPAVNSLVPSRIQWAGYLQHYAETEDYLAKWVTVPQPDILWHSRTTDKQDRKGGKKKKETSPT